MMGRGRHAKQQKTAENLARLATVSKDGKDTNASANTDTSRHLLQQQASPPASGISSHMPSRESSLFDGTAEQYPLASLHFTMLSLLLLLLLPVYTHRWDCTVEKGEKVTMIH